jgi:hypothetical protein
VDENTGIFTGKNSQLLLSETVPGIEPSNEAFINSGLVSPNGSGQVDRSHSGAKNKT